MSAVQQPQVEATIDRTSVEVGQEVVVTVRIRTDGGVPAQASVPPMTGFDLIGTSQSSSFTSQGNAGTRATTWEYRLRATDAGPGVIGPIRVRVGTEFLDAGTLSVAVIAVGGATPGVMDERIAAIVDSAPGPGETDDVTVALVPSTDTIVLGEQLDLVVVAWFPRDIRSRLRTRPTLTPPEVQGAWTYPRTAALGVVDTRRVNGRLYDLYVHHQLAFPLTAGPLSIGRASVSYSLPLRTSILSREMPQEVQSEGLSVIVRPQPSQGRPNPYTGAAAADLEFAVEVEAGPFGMGQAITITAAVSGRGNVALWPEPEFRWPDGVRVYPGRTDVDIVSEDGFIGGTKTFSYLVAPDSAGTYTIPGPAYSYFALDSGRYVRESMQPIELIARGQRGGPTAGTIALPELMAPRGVSPLRSWPLGGGIARVLAVLGLPPLLALMWLAVPRIVRARRTRVANGPGGPALEVLDREFRSKLEHLVPVTHAREGDGLPAALRAAGVEASLATHASRVRDRLRGAVYGRDGASDPDELVAEVHEVLGALPGGARGASGVRRRRPMGIRTPALVLAVIAAPQVRAQAPPPEQLFAAGAYQAAADSFRLRATRDPGEPSHWFNAGSASFGAGQPVRARVAWIRAARLFPRDREIKNALRLVPALDASAKRSTWVAPVNVEELFWLAGLLWGVGWLMVAAFGPTRRMLVVIAASVLVVGAGGFLHQRYAVPMALVVNPQVILREAPYGGAPVVRRFIEGSAVRVEDEEGAWVLIRRGEDAGWVLAREIGRI